MHILAPLAVTPECQGMGGIADTHGPRALEADGKSEGFVLGHVTFLVINFGN